MRPLKSGERASSWSASERKKRRSSLACVFDRPEAQPNGQRPVDGEVVKARVLGRNPERKLNKRPDALGYQERAVNPGEVGVAAGDGAGDVEQAAERQRALRPGDVVGAGQPLLGGA